jgi:hypothetical protein
MRCLALFVVAAAQTPYPEKDWPFPVADCTNYTACIWHSDGDLQVDCCNETIKQGRLCRECTNTNCNPLREKCHAQNATGTVDAMCKFCLATAAKMIDDATNFKKFRGPNSGPNNGRPFGKGKGPPFAGNGKKGNPAVPRGKGSQWAKMTAATNGARRAAETYKPKFPNMKGKMGKGAYPGKPPERPYGNPPKDKRTAGKKGPPTKKRKDL